MAQLILDDDEAIYDFVIGGGNGVKGLVDTGLISKVPNKFIQPPNERILQLPTDFQKTSEAIDLSKLDGPNHDQVVEAIIKAAENIGFFQVVDHGVPLKVLDSLKDSAYRFFDQPPEVKALYLPEVTPSTLVKYNSSFTRNKDLALEWRDFLNMIYTNDEEAREHWPEECKEAALDYLNSSKKLVRRIMEILLENIGLTPPHDNDNIKLLDSLIYPRAVYINFYPTCPNPDLTVGVKGHTDITALTVLLQDGIEGLQVKLEEDLVDQSLKKGEWIEISPVSGALVINIGDMLEIISNGQYKSAEHRVRTSKSQRRVSVPMFVGPEKKTEKIGPLPHLVKRDGVCRYREIVYEDYLENFFVFGHAGRKSLDFAKIDYSASDI